MTILWLKKEVLGWGINELETLTLS